MGPRNEYRGEVKQIRKDIGGTVLQWGRGMKTAERHFGATLIRVDALLQWGRGMNTAESSRTCQISDSSVASMGPRNEYRGEVPQSIPDPSMARASMGPRNEYRGEKNRDNRRAVKPWLQWGRGMNTAESSGAFFIPSAEIASMGPRNEYRGEANSPHPPECRARASMGPRNEYRGERSDALWLAAASNLLQWGRGMNTAESR